MTLQVDWRYYCIVGGWVGPPTLVQAISSSSPSHGHRGLVSPSLHPALPLNHAPLSSCSASLKAYLTTASLLASLQWLPAPFRGTSECLRMTHLVCVFRLCDHFSIISPALHLKVHPSSRMPRDPLMHQLRVSGLGLTVLSLWPICVMDWWFESSQIHMLKPYFPVGWYLGVGPLRGN